MTARSTRCTTAAKTRTSRLAAVAAIAVAGFDAADRLW